MIFDVDPALLQAGALPNAIVHSALEELVEAYLERIHASKESDSLLWVTEVLCNGLGFAPAVRPASAADREFCRVALGQDPSSARSSLAAWFSMVHGGTRRLSLVDDRLLGLWDDQSEESAERLLGAPTEVTHALALAAAA